MSGLLERIVAVKETEVAALRLRAAELTDRLNATSDHPDFAAALHAGGNLALIAEVKRRSPSAGTIQALADPRMVAATYEAAGAAAISVLTDAEFFGGSLADLESVTAAVSVPVLRKDFVIDALQILEARTAGASAVLLIARLLDDAQLRDFRQVATEHGMASLVEVHDRAELERALASGAEIVGVNNRDLDRLTIDLSIAEALLPLVPSSVIAVAESGVQSVADAERMAAAGADAVLVGESLMRAGIGSGEGAAAIAAVRRTGRDVA